MLCAGGFFCYVRDDIMTKIICDRCGKEFNYFPMMQVKFPCIYVRVQYAVGDCGRQIDLCDDCKKKVYNFIFGEKPEE